MLTGPPGAGKSEVATAVHDSLGAAAVANALIELDELARCYPALTAERSHSHLRLLCESFRDAGHDLLLIVATLEDDGQSASVFAAAGPAERLLVRLEAEAATLERRIRAREPEGWEGLEELIESARTLAAAMARLSGVDLVVDTEGQSAAEAAAIVEEAVLRRRAA